jgi:enoyl-[acyl-carrier-protein] reductase (NADH)
MLPRRGCVEEVADAALFLASDMSGLVTAEALFVNGGQNIIAHSQPYRENWSEGQ